MAERTYIKAAFKDKDRVKALGARWDGDRKSWYIPEGRDVAPFANWLSEDFARGELAADALPAKGVRLASLLADVSVAISQRFREPLWVQAEVLQISGKPSGHVYFELCDGSAKVRAVMWADTAQRVIPKFEKATQMVLGPNLKLLVFAKVGFSAEYGFSLTIVDIDPEYSLGDLEARKREILRTLKAEGVLDANRSLPAPWDFEAVLVLAPAAAAGLGDFLAEAQRFEAAGICRFVVINARFQGEGAAREMVTTLGEALTAWEGRKPDAVVVIRGGGAVNDLAWLNDLELTRYLAKLSVPVITGIGHERDRTTLDEVAHQCCDTPSKAIAHIFKVVQQRTVQAKDAFRDIRDTARRCARAEASALEKHFAAAESLSRQRLADARARTERLMAEVKTQAIAAVREAANTSRENFHEIRHESVGALAVARSHAREHLESVRAAAQSEVRMARRETLEAIAIVRSRPVRALATALANAHAAVGSVTSTARLIVRGARTAVEAQHASLVQTSRAHVDWAKNLVESPMREILATGPQRTLQRGFALVRNAAGRALTRAKGVKPDTPLRITFQDGDVNAVTINSPRTEEPQ